MTIVPSLYYDHDEDQALDDKDSGGEQERVTDLSATDEGETGTEIFRVRPIMTSKGNACMCGRGCKRTHQRERRAQR